jgi:hypothetical protein
MFVETVPRSMRLELIGIRQGKVVADTTILTSPAVSKGVLGSTPSFVNIRNMWSR